MEMTDNKRVAWHFSDTQGEIREQSAAGDKPSKKYYR